MDSWHSQFVAEPGKPQPARNWQRWASPALDKIIEQTRSVGFDDPKSIELGKDYVKLAVQENGGKLGGREIEYFTVDDESDPAKAPENANKLIKRDQVDVLVGTVHSGVALAMSKVARCRAPRCAI